MRETRPAGEGHRLGKVTRKEDSKRRRKETTRKGRCCGPAAAPAVKGLVVGILLRCSTVCCTELHRIELHRYALK